MLEKLKSHLNKESIKKALHVFFFQYVLITLAVAVPVGVVLMILRAALEYAMDITFILTTITVSVLFQVYNAKKEKDLQDVIKGDK